MKHVLFTMPIQGNINISKVKIDPEPGMECSTPSISGKRGQCSTPSISGKRGQ